jgi:hypothetical protein
MIVSWFRLWKRRTRLGLLVAFSLLFITALWLAPRAPLGAGYHDFADKRTMFGTPNCLDVLSNVPFIIVGGWGLFWLLQKSTKASFVMPGEKLPYLVFFSGVALTGLGSAWYHLSPDNSRLPWDLLPMACCFMSIVVSVIIERISVRAGLWFFAPLLALGTASVAYWSYTEAQGLGDYRFYLFVQFFSPLLVAMVILLFPPRYTRTHYLAIAFCLFIMAKLFEGFDKRIYLFVHVSGHSLKHITAALSCYWVLRMLRRRHAVGDVSVDGVKVVSLEREDQAV